MIIFNNSLLYIWFFCNHAYILFDIIIRKYKRKKLVLKPQCDLVDDDDDDAGSNACY